MSYQIVEDTSDGFIVHNVDNADAALSLWYGLDGEVSAIKDEHQETISLTELIAIVAANKPSGPPKSRIEIEANEDLEVDEGKEGTGGSPDPFRLPITRHSRIA
jgi:hypothetical protein